MRLHLVTVPHEGVDGRRFCGTRADAVAERTRVWTEGYGWTEGRAGKRSDITIEPVDVPTDKAGLIAYLNRLVS